VAHAAALTPLATPALRPSESDQRVTDLSRVDLRVRGLRQFQPFYDQHLLRSCLLLRKLWIRRGPATDLQVVDTRRYSLAVREAAACVLRQHLFRVLRPHSDYNMGTSSKSLLEYRAFLAAVLSCLVALVTSQSVDLWKDPYLWGSKNFVSNGGFEYTAPAQASFAWSWDASVSGGPDIDLLGSPNKNTGTYVCDGTADGLLC
jgi:hypothetical protein